MTIEILVPDLPESVADATVATWHKKIGETVKRDEVLVEIETDKVVLEVPALSDGVVVEILQEEGARASLACYRTVPGLSSKAKADSEELGGALLSRPGSSPPLA